MKLIGIDIGGTKINICIGDETGRILISERIATQALGALKMAYPPLKKRSNRS
jgi:predicted NBD/HSP70 family sugar kinase